MGRVPASSASPGRGRTGPRSGSRPSPPTGPVARIRGTENLLVVRSAWYAEHPILIQGPGAGPEVTAAGLMTDLVAAAGRVANGAGRGGT